MAARRRNSLSTSAAVPERRGLHEAGAGEDGGDAEDNDTNTKEKSESEKKAESLLALGGDLIDALENMADHQGYLREREAAHRALAEETFSAVFFWTVIEALVLLTVSGGQIFYLRRFIEKRRYL